MSRRIFMRMVEIARNNGSDCPASEYDLAILWAVQRIAGLRRDLKELEGQLRLERQGFATERKRDRNAYSEMLAMKEARTKTAEAKLAKIAGLPDKWVTGTIGSPFGLDGLAGMTQGMERCARELRSILKE